MAELKNHPGMHLRDDAAEAFDAYEDKYGKRIVNDATRSLSKARDNLRRWKIGGPSNRPPYLYKPADPPESSPHIQGIAVDIRDWQTFRKHCGEFGFRWFGEGDVVHFNFTGWSGSKTKRITVGRSVSGVQRIVGAKVDGIWGPETERKVKAFQEKHGLTADGIWGPRSDKAGFPPAPKPAPKPQTGDPGVRAAQSKLKTHYPLYASRLVVDGLLGPATRAAVKEFQRRSGLVADGIIGPKTRKALGI